MNNGMIKAMFARLDAVEDLDKRWSYADDLRESFENTQDDLLEEHARALLGEDYRKAESLFAQYTRAQECEEALDDYASGVATGIDAKRRAKEEARLAALTPAEREAEKKTSGMFNFFSDFHGIWGQQNANGQGLQLPAAPESK